MGLLHLYPKIFKQGKSVFLYLRRDQNGKQADELLKVGESVVVEGGPSTGKTSFLSKTLKALDVSGEKCIFINATLPIGDWVREYKLFGKNLERRIDLFLSTLPERFYLIIDNAERLQDSKKLEIVLYLLEKARSTIVGCTRQGFLNPKIKVRLNNARVYNLGTGADTFDITYFVVAIMIVVVALTGHHSIIFLAAAFRYLFQGTRVGGRRA
jgi:hypothetical protein